MGLDQWINHPAIQSSLIPLSVALIFGGLLWRWQRFYTPVCVLIGYAASFVMILGITGLSLNTTTRVALWAMICFAVFLLLDIKKVPVRFVYTVVGLMVAIGLGFVFWRLFKNMDMTTLLQWVSIGIIYAYAITFSLLMQKDASVQQYVGALVLCLTTGGMALIAGSALVMQLNVALAAGIGGMLVFLVFLPGSKDYLVFATLAVVAMLTSFMAFDMVIREEDAWVLLPMSAILLLVKYFPGHWKLAWQQAFWALAVALPGSVIALAWLWWTADASMAY